MKTATDHPKAKSLQILIAFAAAVIAFVGFAPAIASANSYRVTTDVSARSTATAAATGVYGIPNGAAFTVICQQIGEPAGPHGNTLYFWSSYAGRTFFIPDTYTDSPHLAGQPPIAGIPMCGAAPTVPTTGTFISRAFPMFLCTNTGNAGCHPAGMPAVAGGQHVAMVCWMKGSWATGDYATDMWFWVTGPSGEGFVSASVVRNQTAVGACTARGAFVAADAAVARYGQVYASAADQALFAAREWAPGPVAEWSGDCPKLPYVGWRAAGVSVPKQNAITNYYTWRNAGRIHGGVPPRGAIVFYNLTSYGHTAISLGHGYVATTRGMDFSRLPNMVLPYTYFSGYLGWAMPG
jgi:hypothetical protein